MRETIKDRIRYEVKGKLWVFYRIKKILNRLFLITGH
jgi:hypothetical protein